MAEKLIIFDLDGTLLDTSSDLCDSMNKMLVSYGFPSITLQQAKQFIGNGAKNFVLRSLPKDKAFMIDECLSRYNSIYNASGSPKTRLYDGMAEVLKGIKQKGALMAIASNKPQKSTDEVYEKYLKDFGFDHVYGNREGYKHKPDAECGEYILRELGVNVSDALVVGDGETDVEFARNLGCGCIAVTWGFRSKDVLSEAGADTFVSTPDMLGEIIDKFILGV